MDMSPNWIKDGTGKLPRDIEQHHKKIQTL